MLLGRVKGTAVCTLKYPGIEGVKLLVVQPLNRRLEPVGGLQVAADVVQAGPGDLCVMVRSREAALAILRAKGHLPIADYLRCRIRYFSGAAAIGSREFVEGVFKNQRDQFSTGRKTGARRMKGLADAELFVLRDLQLDVFG